jgi:hypothetical protein
VEIGAAHVRVHLPAQLVDDELVDEGADVDPGGIAGLWIGVPRGVHQVVKLLQMLGEPCLLLRHERVRVFDLEVVPAGRRRAAALQDRLLGRHPLELEDVATRDLG